MRFFFFYPRAGLFKPANQSKQSGVVAKCKHGSMQVKAVANVDSDGGTELNLGGALQKMASGAYRNKTRLPFLFSFCLNFLINCLGLWERRRRQTESGLHCIVTELRRLSWVRNK